MRTTLQALGLSLALVVAAALPAAAASAPPANPSSTHQRSIAAIRAAWPDHLEGRALQIAWRESGWQPGAVSRSGDYGLLQLNWKANRAWLRTQGVTNPRQLLDPATNARLGYVLYGMAGWKPWRTTSGR
jgi:soluble lytic murein transglycosylase-like protein